MRRGRRVLTIAAVVALATAVTASGSAAHATAAAADSVSPATVLSSNPADLVAHGGYVWFSAFDGSESLYRSAGTTGVAGPVCSGVDPSRLAWAGNLLFFVGYDPSHGEELWTYNGSGCSPIDITAGSSGTSFYSDLFPVGNRVLFVVCDDTHGCEPWVSDGTLGPNHTFLLRDIRLGPEDSNVSNVAPLGSVALFRADDGIHGGELWRSDGTSVGTKMVRDIQPGSFCSCPELFATAGTRDLFLANDGIHGYEPWITNGTRLGTHLLKNVAPGALGSTGDFDNEFHGYRGSFFFGANDGVHNKELWRTDGTAAGTELAVDTWPGVHGGLEDFSALNGAGLMFLDVQDATHGYELWKSNGTPSGTRIVKDIQPGTQGSFPNLYAGVSLGANGIVFLANDGVHGEQLWVSNGTSSGTRMLTTSNMTNIGYITRLGIRALFAANDGTYGTELWITDGTPGGTRLVKDIYS